MKKVVAFGLLAASLIIAPTAAFADSQNQVNDQFNSQSGAALDGSDNDQRAVNTNNQTQVIKKKFGGRRGYRRPYYPKYRGRSAKQNQENLQGNEQNAAAENGSSSFQRGRNRNNQNQRNIRR